MVWRGIIGLGDLAPDAAATGRFAFWVQSDIFNGTGRVRDTIAYDTRLWHYTRIDSSEYVCGGL